MGVTLKDIARETGLSVATISKYVNGAVLKESNKIAVEKAIEKLGYTANEYARNLKLNKSNTIGIVVPKLNNVFTSNILTYVEETLRDNGYSVLICSCDANEELECEAIEFLSRKMVDGIINVPVCMDGKHLSPIIDKKLPIVLIDRPIPEIENSTCSVLLDNETAAYNATRLLIENGHNSIGVIIGYRNSYTAKCRLAGYKAALENYNIPLDENLIVYSDYSVDSGYSTFCNLYDNNPDMTAVFATNHELTLGAIIAANENKIKIPDELSIIGFDNVDLAEVSNPKLTVVVQPLKEIGAQVANLMIQQLKNGAINPCSICLPPSIKMGKSIAIANNTNITK